MPRVNLLPWRDQQRKERKVGFLISLGAAVCAGLLACGAFYLYFNSLISGQQSRNDRLRAEIAVLDRQIQEINDLETQKQRFVARMQVIDKLQRSRSEIVHLFSDVTGIVPEGIYLTSFKQAGRKLVLNGVTQSSTRVSTLMRNIDGSQWLRNAELEVLENKQGSTTRGNSFVMHAEQVTSVEEAPAPNAPARARRVSGGSP
jgi:type IV pilus assembly protein PilN